MNSQRLKNIFENIPSNLKDEVVEKIIEGRNFTVERIISKGHVSPPNFWYDQEKDEFVMLLSGSAELLYDNGNLIQLKPGDYLIIPAHQKHRVEKTSDKEKTIWMAIHYS